MAILFSHVTVEADKKIVQFWYTGIPKTLDDLRGWTAFEDFIKPIKKKTEVIVRVIVYRYGDGEECPANIYEIADFEQRIKKRPSFLESNCTVPYCLSFKFTWPEESVQDKFPFIES